MSPDRLSIFLILAVLAISCSKRKKPKKDQFDSLLVLDTLSLTTGPISVVAPNKIKLKTNFESMLDKVEDSLFIWGYQTKSEKLFSTKELYQSHWLLKNYFNEHLVASRKKMYPKAKFPTSSSWQDLASVKQVVFAKGSSYTIEEWTLNSEKAAYDWLDIALDAKYLDNEKPPRIFWIEGNKMYFIMATASSDWSLHGHDLIKLFTGKTRWLIQLLNRPLEIKEFKRKAVDANGGVRHDPSFYYKPDTIGTYYEYFWFHALRRKYGENKSVDYLYVVTYIYGEKIGWYNKVDEALISIKAKASHHSLGTIDLVGKFREDIEHLYGKTHLEHKDTDVYHHNKSFLILHYIEGKVDWFRYVKTNLTLVEINELPTNYFEWNGRYSKNQTQ